MKKGRSCLRPSKPIEVELAVRRAPIPKGFRDDYSSESTSPALLWAALRGGRTVRWRASLGGAAARPGTECSDATHVSGSRSR